MYFEVYIDVLFAVNWIMNFIILALAHKILRSRGNYKRIAIGSAGASISYCILIVLTAIPYVIREIILFTIVYFIMIKISLNIKSIRIMIKAAIVVYGLCIFIGGLFEWTMVHILKTQKTPINFLYFLMISAGSYFIIIGLHKAYVAFFSKKQDIYPVTVLFHENKIKIYGLLDTGNSLTDPISKKPVCIIETELIKDWIENIDYEHYRFIPFHSIGKSHGLLKGIIVDKLIVEKDMDEIVIEKPILGMYDRRLSSSGKYSLILNPMLLDC